MSTQASAGQRRDRVSVRAILPLFFATGVGLLATDLYLPGVPLLPGLLGGSTEEAQYTLAAFMVTFAACQLLHGVLADRFGRLRVLIGAAALFGLASVACAVAGNIWTLIAARAVQGVGAAAAAAIVPAVVRQTYEETTAVRMLSYVGMAESVVPALGPIAGAFVLASYGWRMNFWILVAVAGAAFLLLLVNRAVYREHATAADRAAVDGGSLVASYARILSSRPFLGYAIGYAAAYAALMTFVGTAPHLLQKVYGHGPEAFGYMQIVMVAAFMAGSLRAGASVVRWGRRVTIAAGLFGLILSAALTVGIFAGLFPGSATALTAAMLPSQIGLGLRFGVSLTAAIDCHPGREASASAMASFLCFVLAAAGNAAVAPVLDLGLLPVTVAIGVFAVLSFVAFRLVPPDADTVPRD